jgi:hypothetical protein
MSRRKSIDRLLTQDIKPDEAPTEALELEDFGSMMEHMGVSRLEAQPTKRRSAAAETEPLTEPLDVEQDAVAVHAAVSDREFVDVERALAAAVEARATAEAQTASTAERATTLEAQLKAANQALTEALGRLQEYQDLEVPPDAQRRLTEVLADRGIAEGAPRARALTALVQDTQWVDVLLSMRVDPATARQIRQALGPWCGEERCAPPSFTLPIRVPPDRCPSCGGGDLDAALRRFADAALLAGVRRLAVVGGDARLRAQLRGGIDTRLEFRLVAPDTVRTTVQVAADCRWAQVIVCWGPEAGELEGYRSEAPRFLNLTTGSLAAMLQAAAVGIDELEASQIPPVG